ncbi:MAG: LLM class F420-dependent oxidoreductase [Nocardiopsaceae bacterium]|nr:LLM class F420-dependent oxidoreductase [Nocardiopsaceae bacterium]
MKLGIGLTDFSWPVPVTELGAKITDLARQADEGGFDSLWVMDHFFQIGRTGQPPESPMPEAYATLGVLAGQTRRIRLGTLVTSVAYRHPGVLLKTVTTLDVLSGGRMYLGVGAGAPWNIEPTGPGTSWEAEGLGIPFPSLAGRFEMLEELLQVAHRMWGEDEVPFEGKHYQFVRPLNSPNSVQRPNPPILVAGGGEKKTLRLVARYADACHLLDAPDSPLGGDLRRKLDVLRAHCDAEGRDYSRIEKTVNTSADLGDDIGKGLDNLLGRLRELAELGFDHVLVGRRGPWTEESLDALAEILPEVHALGG